MEEPLINNTIVPVSKWKKFKLLMWKDLHIQLNHKLEFLIQIIITLSLSCIPIIMRIKYKIEVRPERQYQPMQVDTLEPYRKTVAHLHFDQLPTDSVIYSPYNTYLDEIIVDAARRLELFHDSAPDRKTILHKMRRGKYLVGFVFEDYLKDLTAFPKKMRYDLVVPTNMRSGAVIRMRQNKIWSHFLADIRGDKPMHWFTEMLFMFSPFGPRNAKENDGGVPGSYWREGLIAIQHALAIAYIQLIGPLDPIPEIVLQRYPYPSLTADSVIDALREVMPLVVMGCFVMPIFCITMKTGREKEKGMKVILVALGIDNWLQWLSSFTFAFILILIHLTPLIIAMRIPVSPQYGACYNRSDPSVIFVCYIFYGITCICFCFMMATVFKKPIVASITAVLIYLCIIFSTENYDYISFPMKIITCLDFNMALSFLIIVIGRHELAGTGFHWNLLFTPPSPEDSLSMGLILIMLIVNALFFFALALYLEQLYPGEYGVPQKWNFLFQASYWHCEWQGRRYVDAETIDMTFYAEDDDDGVFTGDAEAHSRNIENDPIRKQLTIEIRQLILKFSAKTIIHELTINVFAGEITVLLGHSGAGKTTLIRMIMGILKPTDGTVHINNRNMHSDPKLPRTILGICPQINSLFGDLTLRNQIVFFSRLKGLTKEEVDDEVERYLNIMQLEDDADVITLKLPASTQRKLMVCCALCGNSRVVLLDEPTVDMEPMDKNITWNLLRAEKARRAIFLTTQNMEEAEVLADRIAILCFGDLKCYGSPFYLKDLYGSGHQLICFRQKDCRVSRISLLLRKYIPGIKPRSITGEEVIYSLPGIHSRFFEYILAEIEGKLSDLKLKGFEITYATIEDVCLEVPDVHIVAGERVGKETEESEDNTDVSEVATSILSRNLRLLKGRKLFFSQWQAMLLKHFLCHSRNRGTLLMKILFPAAFALSVTFLFQYSGSFRPMKPLLLDLYDYDRATIVLDLSDKTIKPDSSEYKVGQAYINNVITNYVNEYPDKFHLEVTKETPFPEYIMHKGRERWRQSIVNAEYIVAASIKSEYIIAWVNNRPLHTQPITLNFVHNAIAKALIGRDDVFKFRLYPLPYTGEQRFTIMQSFQNISYSLMFEIAIGLFAVTAVNVMNPIHERVCGSKEIQIRGGVPTSLYWMSIYVWDALIYLNTMVFIIICLEGFELPGFEDIQDILVLLLVFYIFGLIIMPQYYVLSFLFTQPIFGFLIVLLTNIAGYVLFLGLLTVKGRTFVPWYYEFFSPMALLCALNKICYQALSREICMDPEITVPPELICDRLPICCQDFRYFTWPNPGVLSPISSMLFSGVLFSLFLWFIESLPYLITKYGPVARMKPDYKEIDPDIHAEAQKIINMTDRERENVKLVVDRICRASKGLVAVKKVSFCVNSFECFGLIGPEGAGISNIFKVLNGSEKISRGAAFIKGKNIKTHIHEVYGEIGYCPNFNAFLADLTGRDNLKIFALLRGVPSSHVNMITKELTKVYGITRIQDREADSYSDDNKRKLSVAIAVLGRPSVIYLDEPTKGLDLEGKKHLWNAVCDIRAAGKAIVLGSKSMEESKALCTRLAIVVNGELLCIGTMSHLKERFGQGIIIRIKVNLDSSQHRLFNWMYSKIPGKSLGPSDTRGRYTANTLDEATQVNLQSVSEVKKYVLTKLPGTSLIKEFEEYLTFYMPNRSMKWSDMFSVLDRYRRRLFIDRYTISQFTPELIYQQFAQFQLSKQIK